MTISVSFNRVEKRWLQRIRGILGGKIIFGLSNRGSKNAPRIPTHEGCASAVQPMPHCAPGFGVCVSCGSPRKLAS